MTGRGQDRAGPPRDERGAGSSALEELRPHAVAIAYRMLGSVADAEEAAQEALLRTHRALSSGERIDSPRAYVATIVTRLAIDQLRSARARREQYVGEWLPEPLLTTGDEPADGLERAESVSLALLILLESLTPEQRAAFLLHDVFDYPYGQVAAILGIAESNARQLGVRARREIDRRKPRFEPSAEVRKRLADRFFAAALEGDVAALESLLAEDVSLHGDGGGKVPALGRPIAGAHRVSRTLAAWVASREGLRAADLRRVEVNGQPGVVILGPGGRPTGVLALQVAAGRIQAIHSIVNPDKLVHLVGEAAA